MGKSRKRTHDKKKADGVGDTVDQTTQLMLNNPDRAHDIMRNPSYFLKQKRDDIACIKEALSISDTDAAMIYDRFPNLDKQGVIMGFFNSKLRDQVIKDNCSALFADEDTIKKWEKHLDASLTDFELKPIYTEPEKPVGNALGRAHTNPSKRKKRYLQADVDNILVDKFGAI